MVVCFFCDNELRGERTKVCSSVTPHGKVPYLEKIVEIMGDEFVVIVTPSDYLCLKCTSLLNHLDKLDNDLKLVRNEMLSYIQKKYGILPSDRAVKCVEIVEGHLKSEEQLEQVQFKVPSDVTVGVSSTVTTAAVVTAGIFSTVTTAAVVTSGVSSTVTSAAVVTPVKTTLKLLETQQQQQQKQHHQQPLIQKGIQIYKCGRCKFKSKILEDVRFHMRSHTKKIEPKKPIIIRKVAKTLNPVTQQKKLLYRCQVCSKSFLTQINCLDHMKMDHNQPTPSISNNEKKTVDICTVTNKVMKTESSMTPKNIQQAESPIDVDRNQENNNKNTIDIHMVLNDNAQTERSANVEQELTALPKQEENNHVTSNSMEREDEDNEIVEKKKGDFNIDSLLAAICDDNSTNSGNT